MLTRPQPTRHHTPPPNSPPSARPPLSLQYTVLLTHPARPHSTPRRAWEAAALPRCRVLPMYMGLTPQLRPPSLSSLRQSAPRAPSAVQWGCLGNPLTFSPHAISHRPASVPGDNIMPPRVAPASPVQLSTERQPDAVRCTVALSQQCSDISLPPYSTPARVRPWRLTTSAHRSPASLTRLPTERPPDAPRFAMALSQQSLNISLPPHLTSTRIRPIATARCHLSLARLAHPILDSAPTWRCPLHYDVVSSIS